MGRTYVIDGYNLLHQIPDLADGKLELEIRRERLLHRLVSLSAQKGIKIRVVFDGPRPGGGMKQPGVNVMFASPSADAYIRAVIGQEPGRRDVVIVSSDIKDIGNYARLSGVEWMTSQQFWEWLNTSAHHRNSDEKSGRADNGAPPGWTPQDDEQLLREFGEDDENAQ